MKIETKFDVGDMVWPIWTGAGKGDNRVGKPFIVALLSAPVVKNEPGREVLYQGPSNRRGAPA